MNLFPLTNLHIAVAKENQHRELVRIDIPRRLRRFSVKHVMMSACTLTDGYSWSSPGRCRRAPGEGDKDDQGGEEGGEGCSTDVVFGSSRVVFITAPPAAQ